MRMVFDLLALVALVHCVQSLVIAVQVLIWENLWDMSAQILYAKELGLVVTDIQGNSIDLNHVKGAIIAHPDIHEDIINIIKTYQ